MNGSLYELGACEWFYVDVDYVVVDSRRSIRVRPEERRESAVAPSVRDWETGNLLLLDLVGIS